MDTFGGRMRCLASFGMVVAATLLLVACPASSTDDQWTAADSCAEGRAMAQDYASWNLACETDESAWCADRAAEGRFPDNFEACCLDEWQAELDANGYVCQ